MLCFLFSIINVFHDTRVHVQYHSSAIDLLKNMDRTSAVGRHELKHQAKHCFKQ